MNLTPTEIEREKRYRREERLAILCEDEDPTPEQLAMANADAAAWEKSHRESLKPAQKQLL